MQFDFTIYFIFQMKNFTAAIFTMYLYEQYHITYSISKDTLRSCTFSGICTSSSITTFSGICTSSSLTTFSGICTSSSLTLLEPVSGLEKKICFFNNIVKFYFIGNNASFHVPTMKIKCNCTIGESNGEILLTPWLVNHLDLQALALAQKS